MIDYDKLYKKLKKEYLFESSTLTSYKTDSRTSKVWILPDGKVIYSKTDWHFM